MAVHIRIIGVVTIFISLAFKETARGRLGPIVTLEATITCSSGDVILYLDNLRIFVEGVLRIEILRVSLLVVYFCLLAQGFLSACMYILLKSIE